MKKLLAVVLVVVVAVFAFRWWEARPLPEPPSVVWTVQPFRGPSVFEQAGKGGPLDYTLVALSPEPLLEQIPHVKPGARVILRSPRTWQRGVAEELSWRKPFTSVDQMAPEDLKAWGVRWYRFTGEMTPVGSKQWAEYKLEVPQPSLGR